VNSKRALLPTAPSANGTDDGSTPQPGERLSWRRVPVTDGAPAVSSTITFFGAWDENSSVLASIRTDTAGVISSGR